MIKTAFLAKISILLLLMTISAQGQPDFGQTYTDSQYVNEAYPSDQYSSTVPSGAPVPVAPDSPQELGLQIPSESATYTQAPPAAETSRALIPADAAYAASPANADEAAFAMQYTGGQVTGDVQKAQYSVGNPSQSMMVIPQGATSYQQALRILCSSDGCRLPALRLAAHVAADLRLRSHMVL